MAFKSSTQLSPCLAPSSYGMRRELELIRLYPGGTKPPVMYRSIAMKPSSSVGSMKPSMKPMTPAPTCKTMSSGDRSERSRTRSRSHSSLPSLHGSSGSASHGSHSGARTPASRGARRGTDDVNDSASPSTTSLGSSWRMAALRAAPIAFRPEVLQPFGHTVRRVPSSSSLTHPDQLRTWTPPATPDSLRASTRTLAEDVEAQLLNRVGSIRYTPRALTPRHLYRKLDTLSAID